MNLPPDMLLSTGRTVTHSAKSNGSLLALASPGREFLTSAEAVEYCQRARQLDGTTLKTSAALRSGDTEFLRAQDLNEGAEYPPRTPGPPIEDTPPL